MPDSYFIVEVKPEYFVYMECSYQKRGSIQKLLTCEWQVIGHRR